MFNTSTFVGDSSIMQEPTTFDYNTATPLTQESKLLNPRHTIEDLWKIDIDPTRSVPIHLAISNPPTYIDPLEPRVKDVYANYKRLVALNAYKRVVRPDYKLWHERLRYKAHILLIKWGVII